MVPPLGSDRVTPMALVVPMSALVLMVEPGWPLVEAPLAPVEPVEPVLWAMATEPANRAQAAPAPMRAIFLFMIALLRAVVGTGKQPRCEAVRSKASYDN